MRMARGLYRSPTLTDVERGATAHRGTRHVPNGPLQAGSADICRERNGRLFPALGDKGDTHRILRTAAMVFIKRSHDADEECGIENRSTCTRVSKTSCLFVNVGTWGTHTASSARAAMVK
jgi:hypothetical protein